MKRFKAFIKDEISGWKGIEIFWLLFANIALLMISLILGDTAIGILASLTGVTCVILCGKGKLSNYIFGTVNVLLYAYVAWKARYYGDVMLNLHNLFGEYRPDRTWNVILHPRAGAIYNFGVTDGSPLLGLGIQNSYRLNEKWDV